MEKWVQYQIFKNFSNLFAGSTIKDNNFPLQYSLALHTNQEKKLILQNRLHFIKQFPNAFQIVSLNQIHSNIVFDLDNIKFNEKWNNLALNGDGFVTSKKNLLLTIFTADCAAILAYEPKSNIIGAVHAGWRGTKLKIVKNMIELMHIKGAKKENILIAISPMIKKCCYEVDKKVAINFFNYPTALEQKLNQKFMLDIALVNKMILLQEGIKEKNIQIAFFCTSCHNEKFFSYRKGDKKGRFLSFIGNLA